MVIHQQVNKASYKAVKCITYYLFVRNYTREVDEYIVSPGNSYLTSDSGAGPSGGGPA